MVIGIGIIGWVLYSRHDEGKEWMSPGESVPFIIPLSIGNLGKNKNMYKSKDVNITIILNTVIICAILIMNILFKQYQKKVIRKVDEINISPGDFTVMVSNIPQNKTKDEIKEWLLKHQEGEIKDVNLCYNIKEEILKIDRVNHLKKILNNFNQFKEKNMYKRYDKKNLQKEILILEKDIEMIKNKVQGETSSEKFTGKAFVVFNKQK